MAPTRNNEKPNIFFKLRQIAVTNRNAAWNIAGGVFPALSAVIAIPILIKHLGYELFAITSLLITLAIFFHVYDFGIGRAMSFFFPKNTNRCIVESRNLLYSGLIIAVIFGVVVSCGFFVASPIIAGYWLRLPAHFVPSVSNALQIATLGIIPSVISSTLKGILEGRSEFNHANMGKILSGSLVFIAPLFAIAAGKVNLEGISFSIVLSRYLVFLFFAYHVICRIGISTGHVSLNRLRKIFSYSAWAATAGFFSTMFIYGDRFIVARYLSPESLSIYTVSQDILIRMLLIPWAMAMSLMPVFAADRLAVKEVYEQYRIHNKQIIRVSLLMISLFLIFFYPGFYLWLGPDFIHNAVLVIVVQAVGILFCTMSQLPLVYAYARGAPHLVASIYGAEALLYLAIGPWAFDKYGIMGAAVIWTSRLVIEYFALNLLAKRLIK